MPEVYIASENPFSQIENLAIAIGYKGTHIGILFRSDGEDVKLIHLGWHDNFCCGNPDYSYVWIPCKNMHPLTLDNIADWLDSFWKTHGKNIPYSIKPFYESPFDSNKMLRPRELGDGFTCATFVLWAFYQNDVPLVNVESWEDREEDRVWKENILEHLRQYKPVVPPEHIAAQQEYVNTASRFRPVEVAGAAAVWKDEPIMFSDAELLGKCVLERIGLHGML